MYQTKLLYIALILISCSRGLNEEGIEPETPIPKIGISTKKFRKSGILPSKRYLIQAKDWKEHYPS